MSGRQKCTEYTPMPEGDEGYWQHVDAVEVSDNDYGAWYECPHCGKRFYAEFPE